MTCFSGGTVELEFANNLVAHHSYDTHHETTACFLDRSDPGDRRCYDERNARGCQKGNE